MTCSFLETAVKKTCLGSVTKATGKTFWKKYNLKCWSNCQTKKFKNVFLFITFLESIRIKFIFYRKLLKQIIRNISC